MIWVALIAVACISAVLVGLFAGKPAPMPSKGKKWYTEPDEMVGQPIINFIAAWRSNPKRFRMRWDKKGVQEYLTWPYPVTRSQCLLVIDKEKDITFRVYISNGRFVRAEHNGEMLTWINHWEGRYLIDAVMEIVEDKLRRHSRIKNLAITREREAREAEEKARRQEYIDIYSKGGNE